MRITLRHAFSTVVISVLLLSGCNNDDHTNDVKPATVQKSSQYYRVLSMLNVGNDELYLGTQEGLMLAKDSGGNVVTVQSYNTTSNPPIGDKVVRAAARSSDRKYLAIATNKGLTVEVLDDREAIATTAIMTKTSNPELGRNDNFQDVLFINDTVIATVLHVGVVIGKVQEDGTISRFNVYTRETTPGLVSRAVKALAVNSNQDTVLIGSVGGGLSIAKYNELTQAFDSIEHVGKDVIGHPTVDDIAVNCVNGLIALGTRLGLTIAIFDGSNITYLKNYGYDDLEITQCHRVAFSNNGDQIALGNHDTVIVADIDLSGTLTNLKYYPSDRVLSLLFSEDDRYVLIGTDSSKSNKIDAIKL